MEGDSDGRIKCYPWFVMGTGKPAVTRSEMWPNAESRTINEGRKRVEQLGLAAFLEDFFVAFAYDENGFAKKPASAAMRPKSFPGTWEISQTLSYLCE